MKFGQLWKDNSLWYVHAISGYCLFAFSGVMHESN